MPKDKNSLPKSFWSVSMHNVLETGGDSPCSAWNSTECSLQGKQFGKAKLLNIPFIQQIGAVKEEQESQESNSV